MKQLLLLACITLVSPIGCSRHYPKDLQNEFLVGCIHDGQHPEYAPRCRCYLNIIEETWTLQEFLDRIAVAKTMEELFPSTMANRMKLECAK